MEKLLEWVEEKKEAVDAQLLKTYKKIDSRDPIALSMHLWGFLNISLVGDAWETFGNVVKGDGLEAWRRVLEEVTQKIKVEILDLEKSVMHPSPCAAPEQVPMALGRWQTAVQAYLDAGGEPLTDDRRKSSVTKILPWKIQQTVLWDFDEYKSAEELISWIKKKIRLETSMAPKGREAHLTEELDEEKLPSQRRW